MGFPRLDTPRKLLVRRFGQEQLATAVAEASRYKLLGESRCEGEVRCRQ